MININQLNGREGDNVRKKLAHHVQLCMGTKDSLNLNLMRRLINKTASDLLNAMYNTAEDHMVKWTTYDNIKT